jgi:uncharacterized membrane protein
MEPQAHPVEIAVVNAVQWLRLGVEAVGGAIIGIGVIVALFAFIHAVVVRRPPDFNRIRISFARYLALALEFQLAADILSTAVAPSWDQIGKLGAIAVIRTALNFFLMREMEQERTRSGEEVPS